MTRIVQIVTIPRSDPVIQARQGPIILALDDEGELWQPRFASFGGKNPRVEWEQIEQFFQERPNP